MWHFCVFLIVVPVSAQTRGEFFDILLNDREAVYKIAQDLADNLKCQCIVVVYPDVRKKNEEILLDDIAMAFAKGTYRPEGLPPISVMLYNSSQYREYYMTDKKKNSGTCYKWLNIVLLSKQSYKEISAIASFSPNEFAQAIWLAVPVESFDPSTLPLAFNSKFMMVAAYKKGHHFLSATKNEQMGAFLGEWTAEGGLKMADGQGFDTMSGVHIRYVGTEIWPIVTYTRGNAAGETVLDGYFSRVFYEIAEVLNFTHTCISGPSTLGAFKNNLSSGAFRMAMEGKVDVVISDVDMTSERVESFDFSLPLTYSYIEVYYKEKGQVFEWFAMLKPFHPHVWLLIALSLVIGIISYNFFKFKIMEISKSNCLEDFELDYPMLRAICFQGSWVVPTSTPLRVLFWTGYAMAAILFPSYSASLISSLTDRAPYAPFETVDQVLDTNYKLIIPPNASIWEYFSTHPNEKIQRVYQERSLIVNYANTTESTHLKFVNKMCALDNVGLVSHSGPMTQIQLTRKADCLFTKLSRPVTKQQQSLLFPKHSPYRAAFNVVLLKKMESGCMRKLEKQFLKPWPRRRLREQILIDYRDVAGIHLVFAVGVALSVVIAVLECIHKKY